MSLETLPELASFRDLQKANVVDNRTTLGRWIDGQGFPPGFLLGPNSRRWHKCEIVAWVNSRPQHRETEARPAERAAAEAA